MKSLLITICGDGGGITGPNGCFSNLQEAFDSLEMDVKVVLVQTVPSNIDKNLQRIKSVIEDNMKYFDKIYLCGWSLGGATVMKTAFIINEYHGLRIVNGLILLASCDACSEYLQELDIPALFIHGDRDRTVPYKYSRELHDYYQYEKSYYLLEQCGHCFSELNRMEMALFVARKSAELFGIKRF